MGPRSPRSKCTAMLTSVASEIQLSRGSWITDPAKNTALEAALLQVVAVLPPLPLEPPEPEELAVDLDSMSDVLEQTTKQLRACVKLLTKSLPVLEKVEAPNGAVLQAARAVARHFELKDRWEQLSVLELGLNCEKSNAEEKKAAFAAVRPSDDEARTSAKQAYVAAKESAEKLEGAYKVSVAALQAAGLDTAACKSGMPFPLTLPEVEETVTGALAPEEEPPANAISQAFNAAQAAAAAPAPAAGEGAVAAAKAAPGAGGILGDVVLQRNLESRVKHLAVATANTRKNSAPFRNVMLYGPPGTGKTMAAKRLARYSGLDYALMTGGDVAPLGADAVTRIHELFDWASTSRRGLLLFIDEADAFLAKRGGGVAASETAPGVRAALNALLYRTGELSRDVVLVVATNRPEDLDAAVLDRMDESLEFGLPDAEARERMCRLYFDKLIARGEDAGDDAPAQGLLGAMGIGKGGKRGGGKKGTPIAIAADVDEKALKAVAKQTEGFSGREIAKMMASVQGEVYGSNAPELTLDILKGVVGHKVAEHAQRGKGFGK